MGKPNNTNQSAADPLPLDIPMEIADLERLAIVAKEISSGLDLPWILERVVKDAVKLTGADGGTIALLDERRGEIYYPYHYRMPDSLSTVRVRSDQGVAGKVIKSGRPFTTGEYGDEPVHLDQFRAAGVKAILAVPLMIGERRLGALGLFGKTPGKVFGARETGIAQAVADLAAVAIDKAQLFEETRDRLRIQKELVSTATSIGSELDCDKVLDQVVRHAAAILHADAALVALLDEDGRVMFPVAYNFPAGLTSFHVPRDHGVAEKVIRSGKPMLIADYPHQPHAQPEFIDAGMKAAAISPLAVGGRVTGAVGVIDTGSGREFTSEDLDVLSIISSQASMAIENAHLYRELEDSTRQLEHRVNERTEALRRMFEESRRQSDELEAANVKLQEMDRLKTEFLANMSHELRTPLNAIIGFSKLVLDGLEGSVNEEQKKDLGIVYQSGKDLLHLIDELLNIAKIEAGRVRLLLIDEDPALIVSEAVMSFQGAATAAGLRLECRLPESVRPLPLDKSKIREVLMNLIGNAVKFTKEGSVTVTLEQTSAETVFSVADTGTGLSEDEAASAFDRFSRASQEPAGVEGIGLGLSISKHFVDMHDGRIWVTGTPGGGSTFIFSLPNSPRKEG